MITYTVNASFEVVRGDALQVESSKSYGSGGIGLCEIINLLNGNRSAILIIGIDYRLY